MIVVLAKKFEHYARRRAKCGHMEWYTVTEPEVIAEFTSWDYVPKMLKFRAFLVYDPASGVIIKDRGDTY